MIIFGTGGDLIHLNDMGLQECPRCNRQTTFSLVVAYRYFHLYWLLGFLTSESYAIRCDACGNGWEIEKAKAREIHPENEIPIHHRLGFVAGAGAFALLIIFVAVV